MRRPCLTVFASATATSKPRVETPAAAAPAAPTFRTSRRVSSGIPSPFYLSELCRSPKRRNVTPTSPPVKRGSGARPDTTGYRPRGIRRQRGGDSAPDRQGQEDRRQTPAHGRARHAQGVTHQALRFDL